MRGTNDIDVIVGGNIRRLRILRGVTQAMLAEAIGVTFQQLQKYETASNRISVSRLYDIAQFFELGVSVFFAGTNDPSSETFEIILSFEPEIYELGRMVAAVPSRRVMRKIIALLRQLSASEAWDDDALQTKISDIELDR